MEAMAWRCIKKFYFFELVTPQHARFWHFVQNSLGENCCLLWGHLFGKRSDDYHYSKLCSRPDVVDSGTQFTCSEVKRRLLARVHLSEAQYEVFWARMNTLRDQYIAHRDIENPNPVFPDVSVAVAMAEELREILKEIVSQSATENPANEKLDLLHRFQVGHPNAGLRAECEYELRIGLRNFEFPQGDDTNNSED
jgi:hypothetical protein